MQKPIERVTAPECSARGLPAGLERSLRRAWPEPARRPRAGVAAAPEAGAPGKPGSAGSEFELESGVEAGAWVGADCGAAGAEVPAGVAPKLSVFGAERCAKTVNSMLVMKKITTRIVVVRVSTLPALRADKKLPEPPPMPSAPPSERCKRITPIIEMATRIWITRITLAMGLSRAESCRF